MKSENNLQTIEQTAAYLELSVSSLQKLRLNSDFPKKIKVGNRIMFDADKVISQVEDRIEECQS